jgi:NADP-dependent 3-hydroxy acid dehydrogenase YdfG
MLPGNARRIAGARDFRPKETSMPRRRTDPVLVITGGATGVGAATAGQAVRAGWKVVIASRSRDTVKRQVKALGGAEHALGVACDVSDWDSQAGLKEAALDQFGRIDAVFANAGVSKGAFLLDDGKDTPKEWREMILTNVYGVAVTVRLFLPELIRRKGHLLLTGSVVGHVATPGNLYSATKWAVTGMAESIRRKLTGTGVRVTLISPGRVDTPFWDDKARPDEPMLDPDDVARAVMYALTQPPSVDVNEILLRPANQAV